MEIPVIVQDAVDASGTFMLDYKEFAFALAIQLCKEVKKMAKERPGDGEVLLQLLVANCEVLKQKKHSADLLIKLAKIENGRDGVEKQAYFLTVIPSEYDIAGDDVGPSLLSVFQDKFGERFWIKATLERLAADRKTLISYSTKESGVLLDEQGEVHAKLTFKESTPCPELKRKQLQALSGRLHLYVCLRRGTSKRKLVEECLNMNEKMLKMELATDVVIVSGDEKEFKCHKSFLFAHSPVLQAMLISGLEETRTSRIVTPDLSGKVVEAFLLYIYSKDISEVAGNCELCFGLLYAAHKYQVKCLEGHAIGLLQELKNEDFPVEIALKLFLLLGNVPSSEELKKKAAGVMSEKFEALAALPEYDELDVRVVKELNKYFATIARINRG